MYNKSLNISIDDSILVEQCQQGDNAAMERLILKYQGRIYNVILKICANYDDAAELTQDTFVRAIENIDKFRAQSSFYTWLFRIGVNLTLTYCKRSLKLGLRSLDAVDDENAANGKQELRRILENNNSPDPAEIAQNRELCNLVKMVLMRLDDKQRTIVVLRDIEGMNYAQIAEILDIGLGTVKSRLSRARNKIKDIMGTLL